MVINNIICNNIIRYMTGGIMNILSSAEEDMFLVGNPTITLFKSVYRRHTLFATESICFNIGSLDFGKTVKVEVQKIGDLLSKTYLQIDIPEVHIKKTDMFSPDDAYSLPTTQIVENNYLSDYEFIKRFMAVNIAGYRRAIANVSVVNQTVLEYIKSIIDEINNMAIEPSIIQNYEILLSKSLQHELIHKKAHIYHILDYRDSSILYILEDIQKKIISNDNTTYGFSDFSMLTQSDILNIIKKAVNVSIKVSDYYFNKVKDSRNLNFDMSSKYAKFAWVEKLGFAIIDYIEISVGGDIIDRHYSDWMNIWYELTTSYYKKNVYNKMIGNVKSMTTYNREKKPKYSLYIPLNFWFCRNLGLSFPLVALQYNDFYITIALKKLEECAYIEKLPNVEQIPLNLSDIWKNVNYTLQSTLCVDYIFLDKKEKTRFAKSAHEYLIEIIETFSRQDIDDENINIDHGFTGPSKELIWTIKKSEYRKNITGTSKCMHFNYGVTVDGNINPIINSTFLIDGHEYFDAKDNLYMNCLIPYKYHTNIPSSGINTYSFGLFPEEHQPSGSCNFSRLPNTKFAIKLNQEIFRYKVSDVEKDTLPQNDLNIYKTNVDLNVYSIKYNVLRIVNGMCALGYY